MVSPSNTPSISLPLLVRRKIFGSGHAGVYVVRRSAARHAVTSAALTSPAAGAGDGRQRDTHMGCCTHASTCGWVCGGMAVAADGLGGSGWADWGTAGVGVHPHGLATRSE